MSLSVLLPGHHLGTSSFISLLMGRSNLESGTTSSILGGPYLDFGIFGIAVFMFFVGLILTLLHTNLMHSQNGTFGRSISVVSYAYSLVIFILSIHVDFIAVITLMISLSFVLFIQIIASKWYKNFEIMTGVSIILIIIAAILLTPSMFDETQMEHVAIDYCDTNLNHSNKILIDKYSVATGLSVKDKRFQFYLNNIGRGDSQSTKYFFVNEKPPILSSGLSVKLDGTTANKFYTNNYINIYDRL